MSNLVHRLPYHPPLVLDSQIANPPSNSSGAPQASRRRQEQGDQSPPPSTSTNPVPAMWANTWPTRAPETLMSAPSGSSASRRQRSPPTNPSLTPSGVRDRALTSTTHSRATHSRSTTSASSIQSSHRPPSSRSAIPSASPASQLAPSQWIADIADPWNGQAKVFVVFQGTVPGICRRWYDARLLLRIVY